MSPCQCGSMRSIFAFGVLAFFLAAQRTDARIHGFVESFDGTGPYADTKGILTGFDNQNWTLSGDGQFQDGGLQLENEPGPDEFVNDMLWRSVSGSGSFVETITIRDYLLRPNEFGDSNLLLVHSHSGSDRFIISTSRSEEHKPNEQYIGVLAGSTRETHAVTPGPHLQFLITFDQPSLQVAFGYDNDVDDNVPPVTFGPYKYDGIINDEQIAMLFIGLQGTQPARANALIDEWTLIDTSGTGDFNNDGNLDIEDIDLLNVEIRSGTNNLDFDLTNDDVVNEFDRNLWIHNLKKTYFGDANLDGEFNTRDLVEVFQAGQYEDEIELNSTWATGDWNGDGDFNSRDLVFAFQDGGFEKGPRDAVQAVPEPGWALALIGSLALLVLRRRHP